MLGYPDAQILDITGPLEVFSRSARWLRDKGVARHPAYPTPRGRSSSRLTSRRTQNSRLCSPLTAGHNMLNSDHNGGSVRVHLDEG